jgi:hypothetical protein
MPGRELLRPNHLLSASAIHEEKNQISSIKYTPEYNKKEKNSYGSRSLA